MPLRSLWMITLAWVAFNSTSVRADDAPKGAVDHFEAKIRPVLSENCWKCHGPQKQTAGLRLDSRAAMLEGGDTGPALVPGDPNASLLIQAIRHEKDTSPMPPKAKLPDPVVQSVADWIKMGAPWPESDSAGANPSQSTINHWSFLPVRDTRPPTVNDVARVASPIDSFLLARLDAQGMKLSPRADRRTLIRRASLDLTGLPPSEDEVRRFLDDPDQDADAFARVVDRLLASPHYGERWGRHWLDVARYADSKGYVFNEERRYPYAYTYRDYVIRAFNEDLPYDQFIVEQVAADLLPRSGNNQRLAGMGFLTVGSRFMNSQEDILDDRIDVTTRGFLGLSVSCARCHDHKFDPIPTEDYYSLHGVFASSVEPSELPVLDGGVQTAEAAEFAREHAVRRTALVDFSSAKRAEMVSEYRAKLGNYLAAGVELGFNPRGPKFDEVARAEGLRPELLRRAVTWWKAKLDADREGNEPLLATWKAFAEIPSQDFAGQAVEVAGKLNRSTPVAEAFAETPPGSMRDVATRYGQWIACEAESPFASWLDGPDGLVPATTDREFRRLYNRADRDKEKALERKVVELEATHPGAPARAMVLNDKPKPVDPRVYVRGNAGRPGKAVPRRFLAVLSGPDRTPFASGSGRLELAQAIASPSNPLTSRVMVNRIWMQHFGSGLVRTPSDFGTRGDPPTHPELLDWLAARFVDGGWSVKAMHRLILNSEAYQQRSDLVPEHSERDPQNFLLARQNRRRLDFESMRDVFLSAAGRLDRTLSGRPVSVTDEPFSTRRTVYAAIDRQNLDGLFRTFDFVNPDTSAPMRYVTTVPQQALFLMNSPFVVEQARRIAGSLDGSHASKDRIRRLYSRLFQRAPSDEEVELSIQFVDGFEPSVYESAWKYGYAAIDDATSKVTGFTPLTHFTGKAWQFGEKLPHPEGKHLHLTAEGGHVGPDANFAAVRRWVAPRSGTISIDAKLIHKGSKGDGVRGRIVSGREVLLGSWTVQDSQENTPVDAHRIEAGECIDFVADRRSNHASDSFTWAPSIRYLDEESSSHQTVWDAKADFRGPAPVPLTAWEALAQVLLLTNELMYVD